MKSPINSDKHYVHNLSTTIATGVRAAVNLITVDNDLALTSDVRIGAVVKAVYVEYWVASDGEVDSVNACVTKIGGGQSGPTYTEMQAMSTYLNKKNVLEFHQGLAPATGNIISIFRHWIKVPKGKQRFGSGDKFTLSISATGGTISFCGFATFKEYY